MTALKNLLVLVLLITSHIAICDTPPPPPAVVIQDSTTVKSLRSNMNVNNVLSYLTGNLNPSVTPVSANKGSIYSSTLTGLTYFKIDAGSTTGWTTNSGDITLAAVGSSPNGNAGTISGQVLTLQPADGSNPGLLNAGTQSIGGFKTFNGGIKVAATGLVNLSLLGNVGGANGTGIIEWMNPPSSGHFNFLTSSQFNVDAGWEVTPSTVVDGNSFTTPSLIVYQNGVIAGRTAFRTADGSAGAPAFSFSTDTTTGMYRLSSKLGFAQGGNLVLAMDALNYNFNGTNFNVNVGNAAAATTYFAPNALSDGRIVIGGDSSIATGGTINLWGSTSANPNYLQLFSGGTLYVELDGSNVLVPNGTIRISALTASEVVVTDSSKNLASIAHVTVAQGGTGLGTLTSGNVILGAGTSTPTFVAPGTSGNLLVSNGSTWVAQAATSVAANRTLSNLTSPVAFNQDLLFGTDNTNAIGAQNASRPSSGYIARDFAVGNYPNVANDGFGYIHLHSAGYFSGLDFNIGANSQEFNIYFDGSGLNFILNHASPIASFSPTVATINGTAYFQSTNASMVLQGGGGGAGIIEYQNLASSGHYNWITAAQNNLNNGWELTASTVVDGTTFSNPELQMNRGGPYIIGNPVASNGLLEIYSSGTAGSGATPYISLHAAGAELARYGVQNGDNDLYINNLQSGGNINFVVNGDAQLIVTAASGLIGSTAGSHYALFNSTDANGSVIILENSGSATGLIGSDTLIGSGSASDFSIAAINNLRLYVNNGSGGPVFVASTTGALQFGQTSTTLQHSLNTLTAAATSCGTLVGATGCVQMTINGNTHYVPYF